MTNFPGLKPGDKLRVIAPSGALREWEPFEKGVEIWRSHGYKIEFTPGFDQSWGYLAGNDENRRQQLLEALTDETCRGILCARGGFGSTRLLEGWNWDNFAKIATIPKFLIGFSDITGLLWAFSHHSHIIGIHGPVLTTLATEPDWSIQRLFEGVETGYFEVLQGESWIKGYASGRLFPANLTVATHLLGTTYQPDLTNTIIALEDVNEEPYRLDRMLTHWRMVGAFKGVQGIALGRFSRCEAKGNPNSFTIEEVLRDRLGDLGIPIVSNLPFGHEGSNAILPVGRMAHLDGEQGTLSFS
ncbi:Putative carboxypeptidase slr1534 [Planktothrix tepida]|uniref:Carboxypeptidase slr1534 n=2 Tax=Planktothrix TaxID=54304 RepID=A0A9W4CEZ8_9CYAN|nr:MULTISPECIES: LD-carboxypeptidase [Planktothrix]CAD5920008.1 Putative carboxypeptidase slr1534 [Planktothrix pseudagardhii]CAD5981741.1 Putative carboxypeptidase slr1534 [Planktothrix tepida]CUR33845.1 putative enzyme [Planktothrix tepida PCC 9214]